MMFKDYLTDKKKSYRRGPEDAPSDEAASVRPLI